MVRHNDNISLSSVCASSNRPAEDTKGSGPELSLDSGSAEKKETMDLKIDKMDSLFSTNKCELCGCRSKEMNSSNVSFSKTSLCETVRYMRYRAFLKWFHGAHRQEWNRPLVFLLFVLTAAVVTFAYQSSYIKPEWLKTFYTISVSVIIQAIILYLLFSLPLFVSRWSARISLFYIGFIVVKFLLIFAQTHEFLLQEHDAASSEKLFATFHPVSQNFFYYLYFSFFGFQFVNSLFGLFYVTILLRCITYYYLKSHCFVSQWTLTSIQSIQLITPFLGNAEKEKYFYDLRKKYYTSHCSGEHKQNLPLPTEPFKDSAYSKIGNEATSFNGPLRVSNGLRIECCRRSRFPLLRSFLQLLSRLNLFSWLGFMGRCFCCYQDSPNIRDTLKQIKNPFYYRNNRFRRCVTYIGEADSKGRPHGFGSWNDDGGHFAERLIGYWNHGNVFLVLKTGKLYVTGVPDGPHKSRELGTGSGFMCIRIGWAKCDVTKNSLNFGISNVECSVSGKFYKHLPLVTILYPPEVVLPEQSKSNVIPPNVENELSCKLNSQYNKSTPSVNIVEPFQETNCKESPTCIASSTNAPSENNRNVSFLSVCDEKEDIQEPQEDTNDPKELDTSTKKKTHWKHTVIPVSSSVSCTSKKPKGFIRNGVFNRGRHKKKNEQVVVYQKYKCDMMWCLLHLSPHTSSFGVQPYSELLISVDHENGIYIGGYTLQDNYSLNNKHSNDDPKFHGTSENDISPDISHPYVYSETSGSYQMTELPVTDNVKVMLSDEKSEGSWNKGSVEEPPIPNNLGHIVIKVKQLRYVTACSQYKAIHNHTLPATNVLNKQSICRCSCHLPRHASVNLDTSAKQSSLKDTNINYVQPSCVEKVYHPSPNATKVDALDSRFGYALPVLEPQGWVSLNSVGTAEVLLYIHGFNNSHTESLQILGQMAAFGNFPNHIQLFIFCWPAGIGMSQFFKGLRASENPNIHEAFFDMLHTLRGLGIQGVHILCHSMGTRLFLKSFSSISTLFNKIARNESNARYTTDMSKSHAATTKEHKCLQLLTVTFLNPEYDLEDFVREDYVKLRQYCTHITIFADAKDKALMWSEYFSGRTALGKTVFGIWAPASFPPKTDRNNFSFKRPLHFLNTISFFHFSAILENAIGEDGRELNAQDIDWLDVDVIDTTFMDQNVHNLRHSFWSLNREIIEDIRELMVTRKRARQRTERLDRRDGNVWVYRVAPAFLTSIFEMAV